MTCDYRTLTQTARAEYVAYLMGLYEKHTAAKQNLVGFAYGDKWYYFKCETFDANWCKLDRESSKRGGKVKVRLRMTEAAKKECLEKYDCMEFEASFLTLNKNRGCAFERYVTETLCGETWKKDNVPFYMAGDVKYQGVETQVKLDGAQVVMEETLLKEMWRRVA